MDVGKRYSSFQQVLTSFVVNNVTEPGAATPEARSVHRVKKVIKFENTNHTIEHFIQLYFRFYQLLCNGAF